MELKKQFKVHKKNFIPLVFIFFITLVFSIEITTFDIGLTSENLTFSSDTVNYCFQEYANVSTSCGGLSSGTYSFTGGWGNPENLIDGNYGTYANSLVDNNGNLTINYTKPNLYDVSAIWQINTTKSFFNITIPDSCLDFSDDNVSLRVEVECLGGLCDYYARFYCLNGSGYSLLNESAINDSPYEEAIIWWNYKIDRNLSLYRYVNVTSAFLNLSGYTNNYLNITYSNSVYVPDSTGSFDNPTYASDNDTSTYASATINPGFGYEYMNFSVPSLDAHNVTFLENQSLTRTGLGTPEEDFYFYNYDLSGWEHINHYESTGGEDKYENRYKLNSSYVNSNIFQVKLFIQLAISSGYLRVYEFHIEYENYTDNPSISLNSTNIWSFTGEFTQTNNKTSDFSNTLNTALNNGSCDCLNCSLSGENCTILFTFNSKTHGKLEYSDVSIEWEEYISPNMTIINPIGSKLSKTVSYEISAGDDGGLDTCYYNVTVGASTEISNTFITCNETMTGTLSVSSSNTNYVFNFFVNDTSGNANTSSSGFIVETSTNPPTGGSGGSTTVIIEGEQGWSMGVSGGFSSYDISIPRNSKRRLVIDFENLGDTSREIELSCRNIKGSLCKYVSFPDNPFVLPLLKDTKTKKEFFIEVPNDVELGDYQFNIVAEDDLQKTGELSIKASVKSSYNIVGLLSRLNPSVRTNFGVPYLLIFLPVLIASLFLSGLLIPRDFPLKAMFVLLISGILSILSLIIF